MTDTQTPLSAPLAELTTLRLGGPAREIVRCPDTRSIVETIQELDEQSEPVLVIGGGSNLVIGDAGFDGTAVVLASGRIEFGSGRESGRPPRPGGGLVCAERPGLGVSQVPGCSMRFVRLPLARTHRVRSSQTRAHRSRVDTNMNRLIARSSVVAAGEISDSFDRRPSTHQGRADGITRARFHLRVSTRNS